jgi:hypothetical protein
MNEARRLPIGAATIFLVGASRYLGYACPRLRLVLRHKELKPET